MRLPKFQLLQPKSVEEAADLLTKHEKSTRIMAGGTDILPRMKYGLESPEFVVGLSNLPVRKPRDSDGTLVLDALMTLSDVAQNEIIQKNALVLAEAAHAVGSYQIRNMGTLGGNLCQETRCSYYNQSHGYQFVEPCFKRNGDQCYFIPKGKKCWAILMSDIAPALFSLGASVEVVSNGRLDRTPIDRIYTKDPLHPIDLSKRQLLVAITVPRKSGLCGSAFAKFTVRGGLEFAAINIAVVLQVKEDGLTCSNARISVGAIAAAPIRLEKVESMLAGQKLSRDLFNDAGLMAADEITPIPHHGFSMSYLKVCLRSIARDALALAYSRIACH
ncbi:MAG TPA: FAD binding domain-containing protein [Desulfomonilaceae bacterium]|nr:FAD binding domain-containing protein [Desulfomonilaceae bacterium]